MTGINLATDNLPCDGMQIQFTAVSHREPPLWVFLPILDVPMFTGVNMPMMIPIFAGHWKAALQHEHSA